VAKHIK